MAKGVKRKEEIQVYRLEFEIKGLPKTLNTNSSNWRVKAGEVRKWKNLVLYSVGYKKPQYPLEKAKLTLTRHSSTKIDYDNLVGSFKPIIDGLKLAGVILDDNFVIIGMPAYIWQQAKRNEGKITILIEEV